MLISGTYRTASGNRAPGEVTIAQQHQRSNVEPTVVTADADGSWSSGEVPPGEYRVTYDWGWSTYIVGISSQSGIEPTPRPEGNSDWLRTDTGELVFEGDWASAMIIDANAEPRMKLNGTTVSIDGCVGGGFAQEGETATSAVFAVPEGMSPDRLVVWPAIAVAPNEGGEGVRQVAASVGVFMGFFGILYAPPGTVAVMFSGTYEVA